MRDQKLAEKVNLTSSEPKDLASMIMAELLTDYINPGEEAARLFCNNVLKISYEQFICNENENSFNFRIKELFYAQRQSDARILYDILYDECKCFEDTALKKLIIDFHHPFYARIRDKKTSTKAKNENIKNKIFAILCLARESFRIHRFIDKVTKDVLSRKLGKIMMMPCNYGQGSRGRINSFVNYIIKYFSDCGYSSLRCSAKELHSFAFLYNK